MSGVSPGTAELERRSFLSVRAEVEAGIVFAAAAIEYQRSNPTRSKTCRAEAEDCYATAINRTLLGELPEDQLHELETMLVELRRRLELLRSAELPSAAAA
jgi:hypothetical protein